MVSPHAVCRGGVTFAAVAGQRIAGKMHNSLLTTCNSLSPTLQKPGATSQIYTHSRFYQKNARLVPLPQPQHKAPFQRRLDVSSTPQARTAPLEDSQRDVTSISAASSASVIDVNALFAKDCRPIILYDGKAALCSNTCKFGFTTVPSLSSHDIA